MTGSANPAPAVSVIMAIKNAARFLPDALASLDAQTYRDFEIVVVDGGSSDDGPRIADAHSKARRIAQTGTGFADAWNCGIAAAAGAYIAFLDADDRWSPDKLSSQMAMLARVPALQYVYGKVQFFLEPGTALPRGFKPSILEAPRFAHMPGVALIRRAAALAIGPFDTRMTIASDIAWFAKLRETVSAAPLDAVVLMKRLHGGNLSHTTPVRVLKAEIMALARARATAAQAAPPERGGGVIPSGEA